MNRLPTTLTRRTKTGHTFVFVLDADDEMQRGALLKAIGVYAQQKLYGWSWRDCEEVSRDLQSKVKEWNS